MAKIYPTGITRDSTGAWKIVAYATSSRTGKIEKRKATLEPSKTVRDAVLKRDALVQEIRAGGVLRAQGSLTVLDYAKRWWPVVEERVQSVLTRDRYRGYLYNHILPDLGAWDIRQIDPMALKEWLYKQRDRHELINELPGRTKREPAPYSVHTVNSWWRVLKMMLQDAVGDLGLPRDPTLRIEPREEKLDPDKLGDETINTLNATEVVALLNVCKVHYPQWFAFVVLGFSIGARPGELRPLRWGKDLEEDTGKITIRRSQSGPQLGPTKTKEARSFELPPEIMTVLKEHRRWLARNGHPATNTELVFPRSGRMWRATRNVSHDRAETKGNFWARTALDKPLDRMGVLAGIGRPISPKVFRRTLNDVARKEAKLNNLVTRAFTGHKSIEMQEVYSTVDLAEKREGLAKIISIYQAREGLVKGLVGGLFGSIPDLLRPEKKAANG